MKIQILFCLFICFGLVTPEASYYCGRRLANALDTFCDGHLIKRSDPRPRGLPSSWPWIEASSAYGFASRRKRGVVDECCLKPCTVDELMTYCH